MYYIILSILTSTLFGLCFKIIGNLKINSFQTIVINYYVAAILGLATTQSAIGITTMYNQSWSLNGIILGIIFIGSLYIISLTTQRMGITVAQVANKMSMIIPVTVAVYLYNSSISIQQIIGILFAISAVVLTSIKESSGEKFDTKLLLFPVIIFLCSGTIDSMINYTQRNLLQVNESDVFLSTIFATAGIIGGLVMLYDLWIQKNKFDIKSLGSGLILGVINFFTMFFIIKALDSNVMPPTTLFPTNNLSIVLLSSLVAFFIFKEKLSVKNWLGIALSVVAILLLAF